MLEKLKHADCSFLTLTYSDENLPLTDGPGVVRGTLVPKHLQLWLKRFRKGIGLQKIRYFVCGEYGDKSERPHYHAAIFNYKTCRYGMSRYTAWRSSCCVSCDYVRDTWALGNVFLGTLEEASAQYIAGYVVKKMTSFTDSRLKGRYPEFARMSLRPGIGAAAVEDVARVLVSVGVGDDVPGGLRHGSAVLPLGRYLRRRLRVQLGREAREPREVSIARSEEMQALYAANVVDPSRSVRSRLIDVDSAVVAGLAARRKIFQGRKVL